MWLFCFCLCLSLLYNWPLGCWVRTEINKELNYLLSYFVMLWYLIFKILIAFKINVCICVYLHIYTSIQDECVCVCMATCAHTRVHVHMFCPSLHNDLHDCTRWIVYIVMLYSDYWQGFGLDIEFIDHLNTQLVITCNYSAIANFHTLQFTRAHAKAFPALCLQ
jgi:hypothetical protein